MTRNRFASLATGLMALAGIYAVRFILDDTIRTEEDVEHYLGLSVLGVIPESEELRAERAAAKKKRTARARK